MKRTIDKQLEILKTDLEQTEFKIDDKPFNGLQFTICLDNLNKDGYIIDKVSSEVYLTQKGYKFYINYKSKKIQFRPVVYVSYDNYKEINKVLKSNMLKFVDDDFCIVNKRTNNILSLIPFEANYSMANLDLQ